MLQPKDTDWLNGYKNKTLIYAVYKRPTSDQGKAQVLMLTGKALNVTPDYSPKAEELLSKAVKLEPKLVEAWNQLGEVYWKKGDVAAAHTCFSGALTHVSHPLCPWKTQMGRMGFLWFCEFP